MARGDRPTRGGNGGAGRAVLVGSVMFALGLGLISSRALDGASAAAEAEPAAMAPNLAKRLLLRLHDLPLGYRMLDFGSPGQSLLTFSCAPIEPAEPRPRLVSFLRRYSPRGCLAAYFRLFRVPDGGPAPLLVGTAAAELGSVARAAAGLAVSRELLAHLMNDELPEEVSAPETIGDATRFFHWHEAGFVSSDEETTSVVVWRWGGSVGLVLVAGEREGASDAAAFEFARRQQAHLESPTAYLPSEYDDSEVALEDPALRVPVYWLGKTFDPGSELPRLRLAESGSVAQGDLDNARVTLIYTDHLNYLDAEGIEIDTWTRRQWRDRREFEQPPFSLRCRKSRRLDLRRGRAVLYRGAEPGRRSCRGQREGLAHMAAIHIEGIVITVATRSFCEDCLGPGDSAYNSLRGMATVARGLVRRLRPAPVPATVP